jgi:hypothetical protein
MQGPFLRPYGAATTLNFQLFEVDGVDFRVTAVHEAGDTKLMKDDGAQVNTANGFTDRGKGYSVALTATEMEAGRLVLYVVDLSVTKVWLDDALVIETYGHASSMHETFPVDVSVADIFAQIVTNGSVNHTFLEAMEILVAVLRGTTAGSGTLTEKFKSPDGNTDVLVVNYDTNGDRISVETDLGS